MMQLSRRTFLYTVPMLGTLTAWPKLAAAADSPVLAARPTTDAMKVDALLEVGGELKLNEQNKPRTLKMSVVGRMTYIERPLDVAEDAAVRLSARQYEIAEAIIKVDDSSTRPRLRAERHLIGVSASDESLLLYSPEGALTRAELDLLDLPGNSLIVDQLLPGRAVDINDRWQHADILLGQLLRLDAVSKSEVYSELKEFNDSTARVELAGPLSGAINGVATDLQIKGRYKFDRKLQRITWLALLIEEVRSIGHVGPGANVTSRLQLTIQPVDTPAELSGETVDAGIWTPSESAAALEYRLGDKGMVFYHDRRWHVMSENRETASLRMVDRGELVAQCNASLLAKVEPGKHVSLERFEQDIKETIGKNFGDFLQATESKSDRGYIMLRIVAQGQVAELPIQWIYYLIADSSGRQCVLAFTVEQEQLPRLADNDLLIAESVEFIDPPTTAQAPSTNR